MKSRSHPFARRGRGRGRGVESRGTRQSDRARDNAASLTSELSLEKIKQPIFRYCRASWHLRCQRWVRDRDTHTHTERERERERETGIKMRREVEVDRDRAATEARVFRMTGDVIRRFPMVGLRGE
jgi:hypothetical protein